MRQYRISAALVAAVLLQACSGNLKEQQLQRVAKDWSQIIRASQIIPVYPLHEDLLPGDVFLVQTTIDNQQKLYRSKGFLPLDPPMARIRPSGYGAFYQDFKLLDGCLAKAAVASPSEIDVSTLLYNPACLQRLPNVAFPSYSFEVSSDSSLGAALPLQALSVGLSLSNSRHARGSVAIREAYTFGVDIQSLLRDVHAWQAADPALLKPYRATRNKDGGYMPRAYLRVVNRVYVAQVMDVQFESLDRRSAGGEAQLTGVPSLGGALGTVDQTLASAQKLGATNCQLAGGNPVQRLLPGVTDKLPTLSNSQVLCQLPPTVVSEVRSALPTATLRSLGHTLDQATSVGVPANILSSVLPKLRLQATSQSEGSIGLRERFNRPLAVGYLAFDIPIDERGELGAAIPSYARLEQQAIEPTQAVQIDAPKAGLDELLDRLIDHKQPYAVATETLRCIGDAMQQPALLQHWRAEVPASSKAIKVHNQLRPRLAAVRAAGFPPEKINQLLEQSLVSGTACPQ